MSNVERNTGTYKILLVFIGVLVLYLIYYLPRTDKDVMINNDKNELIPIILSTIVTGFILLVGIALLKYSTQIDNFNFNHEINRTKMVLEYCGLIMTLTGFIGFFVSLITLILELKNKK